MADYDDALLKWATAPTGVPAPKQANPEVSGLAKSFRLSGDRTQDTPPMTDDEAKSGSTGGILSAMGSGFMEGWGQGRLGSWADPILGKHYSDFTADDWAKYDKAITEGAHGLFGAVTHPGTFVKDFNETFMRPIAAAIAAAPRTLFGGYRMVQSGLGAGAQKLEDMGGTTPIIGDTADKALHDYLGMHAPTIGGTMGMPFGALAEMMDAPFIAAGGMGTLVGGVRPGTFLKETGQVKQTVDLSKAVDEGVLGVPKPPMNSLKPEEAARTYLPPQQSPGVGVHYDAITVKDAKGQLYGVHGPAAEAQVAVGGKGDAIRIHADPDYMLNLDKPVGSHPKMMKDAIADIAQKAELDVSSQELRAMSGQEFYDKLAAKVGENKATQMLREDGVVGGRNTDKTFVYDQGVVEYLTKDGQQVPPTIPQPHPLGADVIKDAKLEAQADPEFAKVGNLRVNDFKASDDAKAFIEAKAQAAGGYQGPRSGEPSAAAFKAMEVATGKSAAELRELGIGRRFDNDNLMEKAGAALIESAENMGDLAKAHELGGATEAGKIAFVKGMLIHDALAEHVTGLLGEWGRTGNAIQSLYEIKQRKTLKDRFLSGEKVAEGEKPPVLTPQAQKLTRELDKAVDKAATIKTLEDGKSAGTHLTDSVNNAVAAIEKETGPLPKDIKDTIKVHVEDALAHTPAAADGAEGLGAVAKEVKEATRAAVREVADKEAKELGGTSRVRPGEEGAGVSGDNLKDFLGNVKNGDDLANFLMEAKGMTTRDLNQIIKQFAKLDRDDIPAFMDKARALSEQNKPKVMEWGPRIRWQIMRAWKNSILAGVLSHVFYLLSNELWFAQEGLHIQGAGVVGLGRRIAQGSEADRVLMGEGMAHIIGGVVGFANALGHIRQFWSEGGGSTIKVNRITMLKPSTGWLDYVQRSLGVIGDMVEMQGQFSSLARDAYAEANKAKVGFFSSEFRSILMNNFHYPTTEQMARATDYGEMLAHVRNLGPTMNKLQRVLKDTYIGEFVVPFTTVPGNIVKNATSATPAAFLLPSVRRDIAAGGRRADMAIGKLTVGSSLMAYLAFSMPEDKLTGDGPTNPQDRATWSLDHPLPNAVRVGNWWIPFERAGSTGMILRLSANIRDVRRLMMVQPNVVNPEGEWKEAVLRGVMAVGDWITEAGLKDMADLVHAMVENRDDVAKQRRYISNHMFGFVPFSSMVRQSAGASDPYMRETNTFLEDLKNMFPGARETLTIKRNAFGVPEPNPHYLNPMAALDNHARGSAVSFLIPHVPAEDDPVNLEFARMGMYPAKPQKTYQGLRIDDKLYNQYRLQYEAMVYPMLKAAITAPGYKDQPDVAKYFQLHAIVETAMSNATTWLSVQDDAKFLKAGINRNIEHLFGRTPYHQRFEKAPGEQ